MGFGPVNLILGFNRTRSINGQLVGGYHIGMNWPKGPFIHFFRSNFYISKDGVYQTLRQGCDSGNIGYFFLARFIALLEVVLYFITLPFMLVTYLVLLLLALICAIPLTFLLPFKFNVCCIQFFGIKIENNRVACQAFWQIFLQSIVSILYSFVYCATSPFQIIVPELTQLLLKQHTWNTLPFAYF